MPKYSQKQLMLSSAIILLPMLIGLLIWDKLPHQIATHWGADGSADGFSGKAFAVFVIPLIFLLLQWICVFFTKLDKQNREQSPKVISMVLWIIPLISLLVCSFTYAIALGSEVRIDLFVRILLGLMFLLLGNYMPKCKQNNTIGIKVPWTLHNEENWYHTHRFAGRLWVCGGILLIATLFVPLMTFVGFFIPIILILALAPMLYSYLYYRKQLKAGTVTKEDVLPTSSEKNTTIIASAIGGVILILAFLFLFSGKYEMTLDDTSLTINANYWDDATVTYTDIDQIVYRESAPGTRIWGFGTPFIIMGECESEEFGKHTRYTHTACDACILITVDDKILIINGKDQAATQALYESLIEIMIK